VIAAIWPDRTRPEFIVPMPVNLREGRGRSRSGFLKGIGRDLRWSLWRAIKQVELFRLYRPACNLRSVKRWATYLVSLDFGALSDDALVYKTLDAFVAKALTRDERRARYTSYRCKRLAKPTIDEADTMDTADYLLALSFITQSLGLRASGSEGRADAA
jgi:hypothetical protein